MLTSYPSFINTTDSILRQLSHAYKAYDLASWKYQASVGSGGFIIDRWIENPDHLKVYLQIIINGLIQKNKDAEYASLLCEKLYHDGFKGGLYKTELRTNFKKILPENIFDKLNKGTAMIECLLSLTNKETKLGNASIYILPDELLIKIFSYLTIKDLAAISLVSSNMNRLAKDNHLWFNLFNNRSKTINLNFNSKSNYKDLNKKRETLKKFKTVTYQLNSLLEDSQGSELDIIAKRMFEGISYYSIYFYPMKIRLAPWKKSFIQLFDRLVHSAVEYMDSNLVRALEGALCFALRLCDEEYHLIYPARDVFYKIIKLILSQQLNFHFTEKSKEFYFCLINLKQCVSQTPEEVLSGLSWKKDELLSLIEDVFKKTYEKFIASEYRLIRISTPANLR